MAKFHEEIFSDKDTPSGLNQALDLKEVTLRHDSILEEYYMEWTQKFQEDSDPNGTSLRFLFLFFSFGFVFGRVRDDLYYF